MKRQNESDSEHESDADSVAAASTVAVTGESRLSKRRRTADDTAHEDVHVMDGLTFEIEWEMICEDDNADPNAVRTKWLPVTMRAVNTNKIHRFTSDEDDEDYEDVPIIEVQLEASGPIKEMCFISVDEVYDIEDETVRKWRKQEPVQAKVNGQELSLKFTNEDELRACISVATADVVKDVIESFRQDFDNLPVTQQRDLGGEILAFKSKLTDKLVAHFAVNPTGALAATSAQAMVRGAIAEAGLDRTK